MSDSDKKVAAGSLRSLKLSELANQFLTLIGEDPERDGLLDTPERFSNGYLEMFRGYDVNTEDFVRGLFEKTFSTDNDSMVIETKIPVRSFCEHHIVPFFGTCHIGYIPNDRVVGLSKLVRVVDHFSRRLQIQEQLTEQIAKSIEEHLDCRGVIVTMKCVHLCMFYRGVGEKVFATTSKVLGVFERDAIARQEFLSLSGPIEVF